MENSGIMNSNKSTITMTRLVVRSESLLETLDSLYLTAGGGTGADAKGYAVDSLGLYADLFSSCWEA